MVFLRDRRHAIGEIGQSERKCVGTLHHYMRTIRQHYASYVTLHTFQWRIVMTVLANNTHACRRWKEPPVPIHWWPVWDLLHSSAECSQPQCSPYDWPNIVHCSQPVQYRWHIVPYFTHTHIHTQDTCMCTMCVKNVHLKKYTRRKSQPSCVRMGSSMQPFQENTQAYVSSTIILYSTNALINSNFMYY